MGKAKKPIPRGRNSGEADENRRRLTRTLTSSEAAEIKAEWEKAEKARSLLARVLAIEAGLIPPPWLKLKEEPEKDAGQENGPKRRVRAKEASVMRVLRELYPPDGRVSADTTTTEVHARVRIEFEKRGTSSAPSYETVRRALGRRDR